MPDYTKFVPKAEERHLFESFVTQVDDSFAAYKKGSSIDRTLYQTKFKTKSNVE